MFISTDGEPPYTLDSTPGPHNPLWLTWSHASTFPEAYTGPVRPEPGDVQEWASEKDLGLDPQYPTWGEREPKPYHGKVDMTRMAVYDADHTRWIPFHVSEHITRDDTPVGQSIFGPGLRDHYTAHCPKGDDHA